MACASVRKAIYAAISALVVLGHSGAAAGQVGSARLPAQISLVPSPRLTIMSPGVGRLDGGTIDPFKSTLFDAAFQVLNSGDKPATIAGVSASCVCTAVQLGDGPPRNRVLAPGEKITVRAYVDISKQTAASPPIFVWVYEKGRGDAAVAVELSAVVMPMVTFSPAVVKFDRVPAKLSQPLRVAASFDPRLLNKKISFDLVSTNPDFHVVPAAGMPGGDPNVKLFDVTAALNARIGPLIGSISFIATPDRDAGPAEAAVVKSPPFVLACRVSAPLAGELLGNISAQPSVLALSAAAGRNTTSHTVVLIGKTSEALQGLRVEAPAGVSAQIGTAQTPLSRLLRVTVTDAAGALRAGALAVETGEGERLVIPIFSTPPAH